MRGTLYFTLLLGISFAFRPNTLKCPTCDVTKCPTIDSCETGIKWDICNCCETCAKAVGEECGGPWNVYGECSYGLECLKDARDCPFLFSMKDIKSEQSYKMCEEYMFNAVGRCVQETNLMKTILKRVHRFRIKRSALPSHRQAKNDIEARGHQKLVDTSYA